MYFYFTSDLYIDILICGKDKNVDFLNMMSNEITFRVNFNLSFSIIIATSTKYIHFLFQWIYKKRDISHTK